jgi:hypothetical protein
MWDRSYALFVQNLACGVLKASLMPHGPLLPTMTPSPADMIIFSKFSPKPDCEYAGTLKHSFFGMYAKFSPSYQIVCKQAAYPPIYEQKLMQFFFEQESSTNLFCISEPATTCITVEQPRKRKCIAGHAFYGLVQSIEEKQDIVKWPYVSSCMTIEVHTIPGFSVNWDDAFPWLNPPHGVIFVQPHSFLEPNYEPIPLIAINFDNDGDYDGNIIQVHLKNYQRPEAMQHCINRIKPTAVVEQLLPEDAYLQWEDNSKEAGVLDTSNGKDDHVGCAASTRVDTPEDTSCGYTEALLTWSEAKEEPELGTPQSAHTTASILPPTPPIMRSRSDWPMVEMFYH